VDGRDCIHSCPLWDRKVPVQVRAKVDPHPWYPEQFRGGYALFPNSKMRVEYLAAAELLSAAGLLSVAGPLRALARTEARVAEMEDRIAQAEYRIAEAEDCIAEAEARTAYAETDGV
jgi:hypothetical protein